MSPHLPAVLRKQGARKICPLEVLAEHYGRRNFFTTSEVPIEQVFSDNDDASSEAKTISDHQRSIMDDLVRSLLAIMAVFLTRPTGSSLKRCRREFPFFLVKKRFSLSRVPARGLCKWARRNGR